jgi:uncharacterized protein (TIGR00252 family)
MVFFPWKRKSPRLPDYDYSQEGAYFVTLCLQGRKCLLGEILDSTMRFNQAGAMMGKWWKELERKFPSVKTDYHVVMPNHFHGIVFIASPEAPVDKGGHVGPPLQRIVQWFKTMTTNEYIHGVKEHGWTAFQGNLWQRSFYDHIIRDEDSLNRIRDYITNNPLRWQLDRENPRRQGEDDFDCWLASFESKPALPTRRGGPMCPPLDPRRQLGDAGEDLAAAALKKQGYKILARNYICSLGEIDVIARQGKTYVFIEVKTRKSDRFGAPQEAVHQTKQRKLHLLADYYLKQKRLGEVPLRFDVVAIAFEEAGPRLEIIQNAF